MARRLTLTALEGIPHVQSGDNLAELLGAALERAQLDLLDGDLLVVAQKIVSKSEGRLVDLRTVDVSARAQELASEVEKDPRIVELVLRESRRVLRQRTGLLIVEHRLGFVCANAGIDQSNLGKLEDHALLLPEDPDRSARELKEVLGAASGADFGVIIIDSHGRAWRLGTVGVAIGVAGAPALLDLRGSPDMFGRKLQVTEVGIADEMAAAASALMGQDRQEIPAVHVRGFPYPLASGSLQDLIRPEDEDLFR